MEVAPAETCLRSWRLNQNLENRKQSRRSRFHILIFRLIFRRWLPTADRLPTRVAPHLLRAIEELGFLHPMPIQEMVIPHLLSKEGDVIGLAQTGTGKTAAFGLPLLQRIRVSDRHPQALIIAPTRELCLQIAGDLADFSKYEENLKILPVYGGSSIESQIRTLQKGVHVIVATPGRLIDLIKRGVVKLADVHTVILDEADEDAQHGIS